MSESKEDTVGDVEHSKEKQEAEAEGEGEETKGTVKYNLYADIIFSRG